MIPNWPYNPHSKIVYDVQNCPQYFDNNLNYVMHQYAYYTRVTWTWWCQGVKFCTFFLLKDLDRQIVKTESASVKIPELDFEIPAFSQKGGL